jgi:hypothetical protein
LNETIEDLEEAVECNIKKLLKIFEENPAYFLSERDVQCYLYSLLINDERIKKLSPLVKSGGRLGDDKLNRDSRTLLVHAEKPRAKDLPQHDIFILPPYETISFSSLKPMIGIEIKFNVGPFKVIRKTSTSVEDDIKKLLKDEALKQRYLLWLNWGRRMSVENENYVNEKIIEPYKNKNIEILTISLQH